MWVFNRSKYNKLDSLIMKLSQMYLQPKEYILDTFIELFEKSELEYFKSETFLQKK